MLQDFTPKLITRLTEGYHLADFRADALAALTVAIVALPLSMAIAIASGVGPERGLYAAIVGGFLVSLLSGSRYQIGGPVGAMIVVVASATSQIGIDGVILATALSGVFIAAFGVLRAGGVIRLVPSAVSLAFSTGIAFIIFVSQITDFTGVTVSKTAIDLPMKIGALWLVRGDVSGLSIAMGVGVVTLIVLLRHVSPRLPSLLIVVVASGLCTWFFDLPLETVADRFGALPHWLTIPHIPTFNMDAITQALPWAVRFAVLGTIAALLSADAADKLARNSHHRPNIELFAQGIANIGAALFGGISVSGAVARTVTNVQEGSTGPISGLLHAGFVLLMLYFTAPLLGHIPLAAFAGMLMLVAWNMVSWASIADIFRRPSLATIVFLATLVMVLFYDLAIGVVAGSALSAALHVWTLRR